MTYTIQIDQQRSIEWGLNLSEAALFSFCYNLPAWADTAIVNGAVWYFASRNKAIEEMPLLTEKPDTVYRLYRSLQAKGLINWQKIGVKDYICLTEKAKAWNNSENFPSAGKKSEQTRKKIREGSENFPTYNNTIDNSTSDRENPPAQFHVQLHSLETIEPAQNEYTASAPNWMDVAREMAAYAEGEGKTQWQFMAEVQGYKGAALPIVSNWASKASPWQLKNWKTEFRKLQTWLKTEARADAAPAIKRAMQNNFHQPAPLKTFTDL
jgi:hypothetical protein